MSAEADETTVVARALLGAFTAEQVLARTSKARLVLGHDGTRRVVVKHLTTRTSPWPWYFRRELAWLRAFEREAPPVRAPRLLAADEEAGVMALEHLPGQSPLHATGRSGRTRRVAAVPTPPRVLDAVLDAFERLAAWPAPPLPPSNQAPGRLLTDRLLPNPEDAVGWLVGALGRANRLGLIGHGHAERCAAALPTGVPHAFAHGDAFLRNVLWEEDDLAMVDWEFAGLYPWGWDLAVLWVSTTDTDRDTIGARVRREDEARQASFAACATVAAARDLAISTRAFRLEAFHPTVLRLKESLACLEAGRY